MDRGKSFRPRFPKHLDTDDFSALKNKIIQLGIAESIARLEFDEAHYRIYHRIKKDLLSKGHTLYELSRKYNISIEYASSIIDELKSRGYNIEMSNDKYHISKTINTSENIHGVKVEVNKLFRFGVVGDNHLCSKYARLDVLNALYDLYFEEGISEVYNTGNWIDGEAKFNKYDILVHGIDSQLEYFFNNYPSREGIKTYFITGDDHEGWYTQREGINVGRYMQLLSNDEYNRNDLVYIGHMEADVFFYVEGCEKPCVMKVMHPGGGSAYAFSYAPQKIVESFQGGEKPNILLIGHYHKASYDYIRDVHVIQSGCTQDQTPFMRKNKIAAHVGGWIVEVSLASDASISVLKTHWIPFFDRNYYNKKWSYKH